MFSDDHRDRLARRIAATMLDVPERIRSRQLKLFERVDLDYGRRVAAMLERVAG